MRNENAPVAREEDLLEICGARCFLESQGTIRASIEIRRGRIDRIDSKGARRHAGAGNDVLLDLSGYIVLPGLINSHDHLEFATYPRLGDPPYRNYIEWGEDIHQKFADVITHHKKVPKNVRLWWGGIRNLLCGVTTVCHHNPFWPELAREDFPVRVVKELGWAHSVALGGDLVAARAATPAGCAFIVHACEGVDELSRNELARLNVLGLVDQYAVLVHGLALDDDGIELINRRGAALITCPSSNDFLFGRHPNSSRLLQAERVALGSDSPLTSTGDLLDEIRYAISECGITAWQAFNMVTRAPAQVLRLRNGEGSIKTKGRADLIAIRDKGTDFRARLHSLSLQDIELVMIGGRIQSASEGMLNRLPSLISFGLEAVSVDGIIRWLRAPVAELVRITEAAIGSDGIRVGGREISLPLAAEVENAG